MDKSEYWLGFMDGYKLVREAFERSATLEEALERIKRLKICMKNYRLIN